MRKNYIKYVCVIVLAFLFICPAALVFAAGEEIIGSLTKSQEIRQMQEEMDKHKATGIEDILPGYDPEKIIKDLSTGKFDPGVNALINRMLKALFGEVYNHLSIIVRLMVLIALFAILKNLQSSFMNDSVGEVAFYVCYMIVVSILIVSFVEAVQISTGVIDRMISFMQAMLPMLITLLVSTGAFASAGIFQPILITGAEVSAVLMKNLLIPVIFLSTALLMVDNVSEKIQIAKIADLLKQVSGWITGIVLTVFTAIVSVEGSLGAVVDGVASKTAKFAIGAFIPFAGKYLADAADAVLGCSLLVKNAAGVAAMIALITICLIPAIKVLAIIGIYRITAVLADPISDKRITKCINDIASSLTYVFGIMASVTFMFLLAMTALIGASNVAAMIR